MKRVGKANAQVKALVDDEKNSVAFLTKADRICRKRGEVNVCSAVNSKISIGKVERFSKEECVIKERVECAAGEVEECIAGGKVLA